MDPGSGLLRLTRVAFFACAAVGLAASAHAAAGQTVSWPAPLVLVPAVMLVINLAAVHRLRLPGLLAALSCTELVLHEAFMAVSRAGSCSVATPSMGAATASHQPMTHAQTGAAGARLAMSCGLGPHHAATAGGPLSAMVAAHIGATLITALLLARGEAAVWALACWLAFGVLILARHSIAIPSWQRPLLGPGRLLVLVTSEYRQAWHRRGPPSVARAAL